MAEPDKALRWARERALKYVNPALRDDVVNGFLDHDFGISELADGYRAGAAASAERIKALEARVAAFEGALTPGAETKAAYIGEFKQVVGEKNAAIIIEWTTVKEIMGAIRKFALLKEPDQ